MRRLLLTPIVQSMTVFELWDDDAFHMLATRTVQLGRDTGALALLPVALVYRSGVHVFSGEFGAASALIQEADAIALATGNAGLVYARIVLDAWRGVEADAMPHINAGLEASARGEGRVVAMAGYAAAVLNKAATRAGRPDAAAAGLVRLEERTRAAGTDWALGVLAR